MQFLHQRMYAAIQLLEQQIFMCYQFIHFVNLHTDKYNYLFKLPKQAGYMLMMFTSCKVFCSLSILFDKKKNPTVCSLMLVRYCTRRLSYYTSITSDDKKQKAFYICCYRLRKHLLKVQGMQKCRLLNITISFFIVSTVKICPRGL